MVLYKSVKKCYNQKMKNRRKIRKSLILRLSFALVSISICAGAFLIKLNEKILEKQMSEQIENELQLLNEAKEGHVLEFLNSQSERVIDFSSDGYIRDKTADIISLNLQEDIDALNFHLVKNKQSLAPSIIGINIFDLDGNIIASTDEGEIGLNEGGVPYFSKGKELSYGEAYLQTQIKDQNSFFNADEPLIAATAPLTDKISGEKIGVIANYILLDELNQVLQGQRLVDLKDCYQCGVEEAPFFESLESYILNTDGYLLTELKSLEFKPLEDKGSREALLACQYPGGVYVDTYNNYQGDEVLASSRCMLNQSWVLVSEISTGEAFSGITTSTRRMFMATLSILIVALFLTIAYLSRMTGKITAISKKVKAISSGDYGEIYFKGGDEISSLAADLSLMSQQLKERETDLKKFKLAVENASDNVVITDTEGRIVYANPATETSTGFPVSQILGKKAGSKELWGGLMPEDFYKELWHTIKIEKRMFFGKITNKRKDGSTYIVSSHIYPILDKNNEVAFFVAVERDVSKEEQSKNLRKEFISFLSHQLRGPLNRIKWGTELLLEDEASFKQDHLEIIEELNLSNEGMIKLIRKLQQISQAESGELNSEKTTVNFVELIKKTVNNLDQTIQEEKVHVQMSLGENLEQLKIHAELVEEVLYNTLNNALRYSPENASIVIEARVENSRLNVKVSDQGAGLSAEAEQGVFKKHFTKQKEDKETHGLGLFLNKLLIEFMNGSISIENREGAQGAVVKFSIPLTD